MEPKLDYRPNIKKRKKGTANTFTGVFMCHVKKNCVYLGINIT